MKKIGVIADEVLRSPARRDKVVFTRWQAGEMLIEVLEKRDAEREACEVAISELFSLVEDMEEILRRGVNEKKTWCMCCGVIVVNDKPGSHGSTCPMLPMFARLDVMRMKVKP